MPINNILIKRGEIIYKIFKNLITSVKLVNKTNVIKIGDRL